MELEHAVLVRLLRTFGDLLPDPLSQRVDLEVYASKLLAHANIAVVLDNEEIIGILVMYANDSSSRCAHVAIISILPSYQGQGLGRVILSRGCAFAREAGMCKIRLEVAKRNSSSRALYHSFGFDYVEKNDEKLSMICHLAGLRSKSQVTPIEEHPRLLHALGLDIDLRIKRDDLYPMSGGGNKARKIEYIMRDLISGGHDVLVTNGGPQSNHARASAILCAQLGIKCHLVILLEPGVRYLDSGNILLMRLSGATIEFCTKAELSGRMDRAIESYESKGHKPLYVWGGGHCVAGTEAFVDAAFEVQKQLGEWTPEFLIVASGTGTTQAGLAIGFADSPTRVIGISVARDTERGARSVRDSITEYMKDGGHDYLVDTGINVDFRDDWTEGGYESTSADLVNIVERSARAGFLVDTTYSGKALRGLVGLVENVDIPSGSRVLFWHTGGLMNLQGSPLAGGVISL